MKYLIFGTGDYYNRYKKWFKQQEILALLDNSRQKQHTVIDGLEVLPPEEGVGLDYDIIVILSFYVKQMKQQLISLGVDENRIYHFYDLHQLLAGTITARPVQYYLDAEKIVEAKETATLKILLISNDLTLGGPALALFHAAIVLQKYGYMVVYASMIDGPLKEKLIENDISVVVDENLQIATMQEIEWVNTFSLIICNTLNFYVFLSERDTKIPIIWWLHDAAFFYEGVNAEVFGKISLDNLKAVSVGPVPAEAVRKFLPDMTCDELLYGVADAENSIAEIEEKNVTHFITIGFLEARKGQDILLQAIRKLPDSIRRGSRFYIVGHEKTLFGEQIRDESADISEIIFTGSVDREKIHELLSSSDILICPSRQDPMPTVAAEAMMHSVPCIVSDVTGTAAYVRDGEEGFIFPNGDAQMLAEKIEWCVKNKAELKSMGKKARKLYEQYFSMSAFEKKFLSLIKGEKAALYGLGAETKKALENLADRYDIVGLLDSFREDGELYGKQIISFDNAVKMGIKLIIVVARPGSCKAIARKIGNKCKEKGIALMDIRGRDLLEIKRVSYDFSGVDGITKAELREKIRNADVVSFDLFDTLVMRKTLSSDDVIEYVDCKLKEKGIFIKDFCRRRLESEKELSRIIVPSLIEIYQDMLEKSDSGSGLDVTVEELADLEWNIDCKLLVPRKEVCDFFRETVKNGKKVYVVSDTYYSKKQLVRILEKCGIEEYADILASSDCRTDKQRNLYGVLKNREKNRKYLHIGDDLVADIEGAERWGIDTCRLQSGADLLEAIGSLGFSEHISSLSDRLRAGMFISKIFNSPFQFENADKRIEMKDVYDIGYLLCAPVISDFVLWFQDRLEKEEFQNIWFGARDGYLIKKMYAHLMQTYHKTDETVYFLTSRTAAIRAGMRDEDDIRYVDEMKFSGTLEENLKERFGIDAASIPNEDVLSHENGLMKYRNAILKNARKERTNYRKYIGGLNNKAGNTAFFDFVAKGTTQMYIQRLTQNPIKGFYFLQLEAEYMKDKGLDIRSFGEKDGTSQDAVFEDYYILETLLTAPHPSVLGFNESGKPIYASETRRDSDIHCFERVQEGILDYFKLYLEICPEAERHINRGLDGAFLKLVHEVRIADENFLALIVEDPFFNRMTNITDVI